VSGSGTGAGAAGSSGAPSDLEVLPVMYTPPDQPLVLLENGEPIELWRAPQGGHVLVVGARVRGLEGETISLRVRVRDPESNRILAEEKRTVVTELVPDAPGWRETLRQTNSQASHVPVCPNYGARDIVGQMQRVEVHVTELYAPVETTGQTELTLVPTCMQTEPAHLAQCVCECTANHVLGQCADAGRPRDAGPLDAARD
jgi:hypothetical protein